MFLNNIERFNLLPFIIQVPTMGVLCISQMCEKKLLNNIKSVSIWISLFTFLLTSIICLSVENGQIIQCKLFDFPLSINNLSLFAIEITAFVTAICVLTSIDQITANIKRFHMLLLFLESLLLMLFSTTSIVVFFVLLELIVIITFFLIESFSKKTKIAFNFLFSQLYGSIFIFIGVVYVISITGITEIQTISNYAFSKHQECIIFSMFFIGFAGLSALFPLHNWFSDVHTYSPTPITIFLSGIFSIIGIFGFITILIPLTNKTFLEFQKYILYLPIMTTIYAIISSRKQTDSKKIISYISLIHISIIITGIFSCNISGITGAFFIMISHNLVIPAMYIIISIIENRFGTRNINSLTDISGIFPFLSFIALIPVLSMVFIPLFPCFTGLILIVFSYFTDYFFTAIAICFIALYCIFYVLRVCNNIFFVEVISQNKQTVKKSELIYLVPILLIIVAISAFQKNLLMVISSNISEIIPKNIINKGISE